jgi:hypothetical protein
MIFFIFLALYILFSQDNSIRAVVLLIFVGYINISLKLVNLPIIFLLSSIVVFKYFQTKGKLVVVSIAILISIGFAQSVWVGLNNDKFWKNTYSGTALLWHLGSQSPSADAFTKYLVSVGAPNCVTENAPFVNLDIEVGRIANECNQATSYLANGIKSDFAEFVSKNPAQVARLTSLGFAITFTGTSSHYGPAMSLLPNEVNQMFFGSVVPDFRILEKANQSAALNQPEGAEPLWISIPSLGLLLVGLSKMIFYSRRDRSFLVLASASVFLYIQIMFSSVILPSEWFRQNIPFALPLYLISALALAINPKMVNDEHKLL